ncbi:hypothetical protein [Niveibacterium terrae]|uniref:hypothetical protein n=1 Tax=Niveibacterium terrae TaxID=3373598 RepID=UPI003A925DE1
MSRIARFAAASFFPHYFDCPATLRSLAMLDVVRRRGRRWGLLAQYEENRLRLPR